MTKTDLPSSRDGRFRVTESKWDSNGSFRVVILDTRDSSVGETVPPDVIARERRAIRDLNRPASADALHRSWAARCPAPRP